ncbi:hypothetical protein [Chryseobacterium sediminis]|uniref:Lipocalin-like domain-containing protein n=1 Tax=Chryseobacterium sediminis TaxID=1679494 RepID=A0A5B2U982_9FLAO|nr:hypothetical protein [Chryseobacterium sediminis]KAA2222986.1 hypothetical protein FW780_01940 [Chryseobacterium sediminis]
MKKIIIASAISILSLSTLSSCSSSDDTPIEQNKFEDSQYIKSQMIGHWEFWGHKSPGYWVYNGDVDKSTFDFDNDSNYQSKNAMGQIQKGTYIIIGATKTDNPVLYLSYKEGDKTKMRTIYLKELDGNKAVIYESGFDVRYDKK